MGHQQKKTLDFLLTTIPNKTTTRTSATLYCRKNKLLETLTRTDKQANKQGILLQRPLISPTDTRDERANKMELYLLLNEIKFLKRKLQKLRNLTSAYQFYETQEEVLYEYSLGSNPTN